MSSFLSFTSTWFQKFFNSISITDVHGVPFVILVIILLLSVFFFVCFARTVVLAVGLGSTAKAFSTHKESEKITAPKAFQSTKIYKHLWSEYKETLHELKRKDGGSEWRSTVPAEAFFSKEVMVDSRAFVWNDFFRHLPGILTGLGIIGTFFGLISGLEGFAPSEEASATRDSLTNLLDGVKEAFKVSAFAISAAIFVTVLEKLSLTWAYNNVDNITHSIDALYEAGAGEEYLARMVEADESNLANAQQLKNAMVNELSTILKEMTDRQIEAQQQNNLVLANSIQAPLKQMVSSLEDVGTAVKGGSRDNTETMKGALNDLVSNFIEKMDDTLNSNMQKVAGSMENSARSMTDIQTSMDTLIDKISSTSDQAITGMVEKLEAAMERSATNQELMTQQMEQFVLQLQKQIRDERGTAQNEHAATLERAAAQQTEMATQMKEFIAQVQSQINAERESSNKQASVGLEKSGAQQTAMLDELGKYVTDLQTQISSDQKSRTEADEKNRQKIAEDQKKAQDRILAAAKEVLSGLGKATSAMEDNISRINTTTTSAISGMNQGATSITKAAEMFDVAGKSVTGVLDNAKPVASELNQSSRVLSDANLQLVSVFAEYKQLKDQTALQVSELTQLLEQAKQEVAGRQKMVDDLSSVSNQLSESSRENILYLQEVNDHLTTNFESFGNGLSKDVTQVFGATNDQIKSAVSHISGAVKNLEQLAGKMNDAAKANR